MFRRSFLTAAISGVSLLTFMSASQAAIEEIIVTAQHRAENMQDVPVSVTAMAGDMMAEADINGATEIALFSPGMSYAEFAPGQSLMSMRGISSADDGAGMDNSATAFLDGVYIGRPANINFDLYDLERVEVLRGPQGTLFGRNAIGGALNIITSKPTEEFTAKADATVGNEGVMRYAGLISGPLADSLLGKLSYSHREHDGYVKNVALGKDQMSEDKDSLRGLLTWHANDATELTLSADWMEESSEDMGRTPIAGLAGGVLVNPDDFGTGPNNPRQSASPVDGYSEREMQGWSLTANFDLGSGTLTSITAWRDSETDWQMGSVGLPFPNVFGPTLGGGVGNLELIDWIREDIEQVSQEFRWTSQLDGNFNFVAGLYLLREETDRTEQFVLYQNPDGVDPAGFDVLGRESGQQENETSSSALYGQATWELTEALRLTVGLRYTVDRKEITSTSVNCGNNAGESYVAEVCSPGEGRGVNIIANTLRASASEDWEDVSPKIALDYQLGNNVMVFGSISKGFKSGGIGGNPASVIQATTPVDPEITWNYEAGFKGDFLDNTLRLNVTGFFMDYEDLQVVRFGPVPGEGPFGQFVTKNLGEAKISGGEMEFIWAPTENLQISGNYAYLESEISDLVIGGVDATGSRLRQAPNNTSALTINYDYPTDIGTFKTRIDYTYSDQQLGDYAAQQVTYDQFELYNMRLAWESLDEQWEVALWGKNLKDNEAISHAYIVGFGTIGIWNSPATYGVTVTWNMPD